MGISPTCVNAARAPRAPQSAVSWSLKLENDQSNGNAALACAWDSRPRAFSLLLAHSFFAVLAASSRAWRAA